MSARTRSVAEQLAEACGAKVGDVDGRRLAPMLCAQDDSSARVLAQPGFLYELKLDGVRILADKRGDDVTLGYRKGRDATTSYPEIADAVRALDELRVVLDGEIIAFDADGKPDFQRLGRRIQAFGRDARRAASLVPVVYVVFDVLAVGARDLRALPLEARKEILAKLVPDVHSPGALLRYHPTFDDGVTLFRVCREQRLEGVVAKRKGSAYRAGERASDWVKVKHELDADFVVIGWCEGEGRRARLGALDLGGYDERGRLVVRGAAGSGLDEDTIDLLLERLVALEVPRPVADGKYSSSKPGRHHVKPELVVSVRYVGFSDDGYLRFPVFRGIRPDVRPEDCTASPRDLVGASLAELDGEESRATALVRRIHVTAPGAVVLPDGTTKDALCTYYERAAPLLLPHVARRPSVLVKADGGALWPLPKWTPSWVRTAVVRVGAGMGGLPGDREARGVLVEDLDTLLFAIEAGCVSLLLLPFRQEAPAEADFVALRLRGDHAPRVARSARDLAVSIGLRAFAKTAGGGGIDVIVPIGRAPYDAHVALSLILVKLLAPACEREGVEVSAITSPVAPWAVVTTDGRASVSRPLDLDDGAAPGELSLDAAAGLAGAEDAMRGMLDVKVDVAAAVAALDRLLAP